MSRCVVICLFKCISFFFFKQKTAYEMHISDWSSDVCSSDLEPMGCYDDIEHADAFVLWGSNMAEMHPILWSRITDRRLTHPGSEVHEIGRASCRERVCQYV